VFGGAQIFIVWLFDDIEKRALFGDSNGAINTLFSAFAFGGIIYTIFLQRTELELQREELRDTRKELKRTADAQETSNKNVTEQIRINNLPVFEWYSKNNTISHNTKNKTHKILIINNTHTAYSVDVLICSTNLNQGSKVRDQFQVVRNNEFIEISLTNEKLDEIYLIIAYSDILANKYFQKCLIQPDEEKICFENEMPVIFNNLSQLIIDDCEREFTDDFTAVSLHKRNISLIAKNGGIESYSGRPDGYYNVN
jgi:hypothetical protein